jgi:cytochrome P450
MDLDLPVPDPGPPGPFGTMPWLRATVSRFANGETHARRRALVEEELARLDPAELREEARAMAQPRGSRFRQAWPDEIGSPDVAYVPVAVLARALGARDVGAAVAATRVVAAAYQPHTSHPGADEALARLLQLLPEGGEEVVAARVAILVQACEATAGLVRGEDVPVPVTRRVGPDGEVVLVDLSDRPFGAGRRRCPGEAHARALVEGLG